MRKELEILKENRLITPQMYRKFYPKGCSAPKILWSTEKTILSSFGAISMYTSCDVHKCEQALQRKLEENSTWANYKTLEIDTK